MKKYAVVLALATFCVTLSTPTWAQVSADFCGNLEGIAEGWRNVFPVGDAATCPELCRAWTQSCHGVVGAAKRCTLEIFEQLGIVAAAQCTTEASGPERTYCRRNVTAEIDVLKAETKRQAAVGFSFCADPQQMSDCLATCEAVPEEE